ncbi:hypothetical protein chiPu_0014788 [Chiloscyllium punctatum]|uniref:Uncharacterized protein n=1 Tax=Chiloscyllium punctatum TaxID=137246 RepID=A0A401T0Z5_CHIPU|nr:hypothetical protein [Chiloscyllium punctatum]
MPGIVVSRGRYLRLWANARTILPSGRRGDTADADPPRPSATPVNRDWTECDADGSLTAVSLKLEQSISCVNRCHGN